MLHRCFSAAFGCSAEDCYLSITGQRKDQIAQVFAADRFDLCWQKMIEQAVLGEHIANKTLATAELAATTRAKLAPECILSTNWNQLNQWQDNATQWFLTTRLGTRGQEHVQYPMYTSAQYQQRANGDIEVEVRVQGQPIAQAFTVLPAPDRD